MLQAALPGVTGGYPLPPMETGNGFTSNDAPPGTAAALAEAPSDLESDTALTEAVGTGLVANHLFMKRAEVEKTAAMEGEAPRDWYL